MKIVQPGTDTALRHLTCAPMAEPGWRRAARSGRGAVALAIAALLGQLACGGDGDDELQEETRWTMASEASPNPQSWAPVCVMAYNNPSSKNDGMKLCTGTLIGSRRFLTAKHCNPQSTGAGSWDALAVMCPKSSSPGARYSIDAAQIVTHTSLDVQVLPLVTAPSTQAAMSSVDPPIHLTFSHKDDVGSVGFHNGVATEFLGTRWRCTVCGEGEGLLSMDGPVAGDSGGPVFYDGRLAGVISSIQDSMVYGHLVRYVQTTSLSQWLLTTVPAAPVTPTSPPPPTPPSGSSPSPNPGSGGGASSGPPPTPANSGPGVGPTAVSGWKCSSSTYTANGLQYWTCSGGDLYRCNGGQAYRIDCTYGCSSNPSGTDDTCKRASPSAPPSPPPSTPPSPQPSTPNCDAALGGPGLSCSTSYVAGSSYCSNGSINWYCCPYKQPIMNGVCAPQDCASTLGTGLYCYPTPAAGATYCRTPYSLAYCCPMGKKAVGGVCL